MTFPGPLGVASFCKRILVCALTFALANLTAQSVFAETGATNIVSGTTTQISGNYRVGTNGAYNALIVTNAGCFIVTGYSYIGSSAVSSNNNAWVTGPGSVWSNGSYLYVGNAGSFNSLTIANGGRVIDYLNGVIGNLASSSNNSVLVTGTGSVWSNSISSGAFTEVGGTGSFNRLTIANGGWVYDYGGSIGANALSSNNTVIVTDFGSVWTNSSGLYVGDEGSGNSLIVTNGGAVYTFGATIGYYPTASNNSVIVTGTGSLLNIYAGGLSIGYYDGAAGNALIVTNGGTVFTRGANIGGNAGGSGANSNALVVTGSGSVFSNLYGNVIGGDSVGNSMTIANGGTVYSAGAGIGYSSGYFASSNKVTVTDPGSIWYNSGLIYVGQNASFNSMLITNGGTVLSPKGYVGYYAKGSNNSVIVTGAGSLWSNSADLIIGALSSSNNQLSLFSGGTVLATNMIIGDSVSSGDAMVVSGGNLFSTNASASAALDVRYGTLTVNSGTVFVNKLLLTNGANSVLNFNGGTLISGGTLASNGAAFAVGGTGTGATFNLLSGTHMFSTNLIVGLSGVGDSLIVTNGAQVFVSGVGVIGDNAGASNNVALVAGPGSLWSNKSDFYVGVTGAFNTLTIASGGVVSNRIGYMGYNAASSNNVVSVSGSGSAWKMSGNFYLGYNGDGNQLIITNGGRVVNNFGYIGYNSDSNIAVISGAGSAWTNQSEFSIGYSGAGNQMIVTNGGRVASFLSYIGNYSPQNLVLVTGNGSVWSNHGALYVGSSGAGNTLIVTNGARVLSSVGEIGFITSSTNNVAVVSGSGSLWTNWASLVVGGSGGTKNTLLVSDGGRVVGDLNNYVGFNANDNTAVITDPGSVWQNGIFLSVGWGSSGNLLVVSNGAWIISTNGYIGGNYSFSYSNTVLITGSGSLWSNVNIFSVGDAGSSGLLTLSNGGAVLTATGFIGNAYGSASNVALVTGSGSLWSNSSDLYVGDTGGFNQLTVINAGRVANVNGWIGYDANAVSNSVHVGGSGSVWSNSGNLYIGNSGSADNLAVTSSGQVFNTFAYIGYNASATGNLVSVTGTGSVWNSSSTLYAGYNGSSNSLVVANNGQVISASAYVGYGSNGNNNAVTVTGAGSIWTNEISVIVGNFGSGNQLVISNGAQVIGGLRYIGYNASASNNTVLVAGPGSVWNYNDDLEGVIYIGNYGPNNNLIITNGGQVFSFGNIAGSAVGSRTGSVNNTVLVTGAGSLWTNAGILNVGNAGGLNRMTISAGGVVMASTGIVGNASTSGTNTVLVTGAGSGWSNLSLTIGGSGSGNSLTITNAATVTDTSSSTLGAGSGANNNSVFVTGLGSVWNAGGNLYVGNSGASNCLIVANGGEVVSGFGYIGNSAAANTNFALVTGTGSLWSNSSSLFIGYSGSGNSLTLTNGGIVSATNVVIGANPSTGNVLTVSGGSLYATNSAGGGAINVLYGTLNLNSGTVAVDRLLLTNGVNSVFNFNGGVLQAGQMLSAQTMTVNGGTLTLADSFVNSTGATFQLNSGSVIVPGSMANLGTFVQNGGLFDPLVFTNSGSFVLNSGTNMDGVFLNLASGTVQQSGGEHDVNVATNYGSWAINGGVANLTNLVIDGGGVFTNAGGLLVSTNASGTGGVDVRNGVLALLSGTVTVNQFYATNFANSVVSFNGGTLNSGGSAVNNGSIFQVGNGTDAATLDLLGGTHAFANGLVINTNAILTGTGTLSGTIINSGLIAPGNGFGVITETDRLLLFSGSAMTMELGGTNTWLYDQVDVTGRLYFGGTLTVSLLNDYTPQAGDQFNLFDFGSSTGAFSQINLPTLSPTLYWNTNALYSSGVIEADQTAGSLQVILAPQAAIDAGAKWQVDADGNWHTNNETVADLVVGSHTVSYTNLTGWIAPTNQTVQIATGVTTTNTGTYQLTPLLLAAVSRKTQGAGTFDLNLNLNGTPTATVEPRVSGPTQLLFTFNKAMTAVDGTLDATEFTVTNATFVSASIVTSNLTLNLTSVVDQSKVTVVMNGLTDLAGNALSGTSAVIVRSLYGDVNQSGTVNGVDLQQVKNNLLTTLTPANFLCDINCSGTINAVDLQQIKNNLLHSASFADSGTAQTLSSGDASSSVTTSALSTTTLGEALGATNLTWSTDGDATWTPTLAEDGSQAAWSGSIGNLNVSWVETTVTGPGILSFQWKVSSELNGDYLTFAIDGVNQPGAISGEAGWQTLTFIIPSGQHRLTWTYAKNAANAAGLDTGWVRSVVFE